MDLLETYPPLKLHEMLSPKVVLTVLIMVSMVTQSLPPNTDAETLNFLQSVLGRQSTSQRAEE